MCVCAKVPVSAQHYSAPKPWASFQEYVSVYVPKVMFVL